jgi:hypothetical protein
MDTQSRRLRLSVARRSAPNSNSYAFAKCDINADTHGDT